MNIVGVVLVIVGFVRILTAQKAKPSQGNLGWITFFAGLAIAANS